MEGKVNIYRYIYIEGLELRAMLKFFLLLLFPAAAARLSLSATQPSTLHSPSFRSTHVGNPPPPINRQVVPSTRSVQLKLCRLSRIFGSPVCLPSVTTGPPPASVSHLKVAPLGSGHIGRRREFYRHFPCRNLGVG